MSEMFVGIDLGGTNIKIGLFDSELKLVSKMSVKTEEDIGMDKVKNIWKVGFFDSNNG